MNSTTLLHSCLSHFWTSEIFGPIFPTSKVLPIQSKLSHRWKVIEVPPYERWKFLHLRCSSPSPRDSNQHELNSSCRTVVPGLPWIGQVDERWFEKLLPFRIPPPKKKTKKHDATSPRNTMIINNLSPFWRKMSKYHAYFLFGSTPQPVTVTTKVITFLAYREFFYKPSFATGILDEGRPNIFPSRFPTCRWCQTPCSWVGRINGLTQQTTKLGLNLMKHRLNICCLCFCVHFRGSCFNIGLCG